jgi:hypothetical protein
MSETVDDNQLRSSVRTLQIVLGAMLIGSIAALAIFTLLQMQRAAAPPAMPVFTYVSLAFTVVLTGLSFLVPHFIIAGSRKRIAQGIFGDPPVVVPPDDSGKLLMVYNTALIAGAAMLDGATYFLLIAYLLEGNLTTLIAASVLRGLLAARIPTRSRVARWVDWQLELLANERGPTA